MKTTSDLNNPNTNKNNVIIIEKIKRIKEIIQSDELDKSKYDGIRSITETEDKRIASGGSDGNISISSYNINEMKWTIDIHKEKAHDNSIESLCTLNGNRLLSAGSRLIKVWTITNTQITPIKEINEHTWTVYKLIPLSKQRFASCSRDQTVRIWKDNNTYQCLSTLPHNSDVRSILQLRDKDVLVSCGHSSVFGVSFWNINDYTKQHSIKGYGVFEATHMIELFNGNVALSSYIHPYPIVVIDCSTYQIVTVVHLNIDYYSTLCVFNQRSFVYVHNGSFLQISNEDYSVLFQTNKGKFKGYKGGIVPIEQGKYFAIENGRRISIIKLCVN